MSNKKQKSNTENMPLSRENYRLIAIGFAIIVLGFILMIGGKAESPDKFNPDIFNFRRITLAPIIVLFGYLFEIYAIMKKPKEDIKGARNFLHQCLTMIDGLLVNTLFSATLTIVLHISHIFQIFLSVCCFIAAPLTTLNSVWLGWKKGDVTCIREPIQ